MAGLKIVRPPFSAGPRPEIPPAEQRTRGFAREGSCRDPALSARGRATKVLALGGTGRIGKATARILAAEPEVSGITIASRDGSTSARAAREVGNKATAVTLDVMDERAVTAAARDHDLVVNTAGPDYLVALPAIRASIAAGTHYCDIQADGPAAERALRLDARAKAARVTALTGIGHVPGTSNLMMAHAANRVGHVEEVASCTFFPLSAWEDPKAAFAEMERTGFVNASWQTIMQWAAGRARTHRNGRRASVDPWRDSVELRVPGGPRVRAVHIRCTEPITLPRRWAKLRAVSSLMSLFPPELNELYCTQGRRIASGEVDAVGAAIGFHEAIVRDPGRWWSPPGEVRNQILTWATATGRKGGRRVRYKCWPATDWMTTVGPLSTAALMILNRQIRQRGVLAPEDCLEPLPFLRRAARLGSEPPIGARIFAEATEVLE